jgi:hypothetical protein
MNRPICLTLLLAGMLASCGTTTVGKGRIIVLPPIPDGEVSRYQMLLNGAPNGTLTSIVTQTVFKEQPAWRLDIIAQTAAGGLPSTDSSAVYLTRDSLVPLSSFRFVRTGNALIATAANYIKEGVAVTTWSAGEEQQRMLPRTGWSYDTDQLTFLCRALRLPEGRPVSIQVVSPMGPPSGGIVFEGKVGLMSDAQVTVPAGTFDCTRVLLNIGPHVVQVWYEKTGARRMVRYEQTGTGIELELLPEQVSLVQRD